jgi:TetR/AcrR family transcriptional regulator, transcriptional repressor for nem operon
LIDSARVLIHDQGYSAVGVSEICESAGVNKGSFYHFFSSKHALGMAVIDAFWEQVRLGLETTLAGDDTTLSTKLERYFSGTRRYQSEEKAERGCTPGCLLGNLALELSNQDDAMRKRLKEIFVMQEKLFAPAIQAAMDRGEIEPGDAHELARDLVAYAEGITMLSKLHNNPTLLKKALEGALRLVGEKKA